MTQIHRGETDVKMEAKIGVMGPQAEEAKECQQLPEDGRGKEGSFLNASGEKSLILDFWPREM